MLYQKVLAIAFIWMSLPVLAQDESYLYLQQLVQQSRELRLAERIEWLNLLHYKPYPYWRGGRSLADDPSFFNSPEGKTSATSELEATLKAFFSQLEETDKQQNPQCRFVARYHWLEQQLKFDATRLKPQPCKRFNAWRQGVNPHEVTLVFPSSYMNSPASMYGHTLLRIDAKDQDERTRLLAYTVGYAASTTETNGLIFAWHGLTGGYPGVFQTAPYYLKVSEYTEMENRDIWEYRLNLNPEEIERMVKHIWEMGPTYFDYYFFDENCAYKVLTLLDVARPSLALSDEFRWWAIPSDTVRAVTEKKGLLKQAIYRPSNATIITHRMRSMQTPLHNISKSLSLGVIRSDDSSVQKLAAEQQAQVFELSYDYITYLRASKADWPEAGKLSRQVLLARSALNVPPVTPLIETPSIRPDQGHKSLRVGLGTGASDGVNYQELSVRPAYHDQNDPGEGYIRGAQIQFFNLELRHYVGGEGTRIEKFVPIDILSLAPYNDFFQSPSWKINVGWARKRLLDGSEPLVSRINGGIGRAWDAPSFDQPVALAYAFLDVTMEGTAQYANGYTLGMGPAAGVIADVNNNWRLHGYAKVQRFGFGEPHTTTELSLLQRYSITKQTALRFEVARKMEFDRVWTDMRFSLQQYF